MSEDAGLEDRVERLETGQNRIISKLDELLGGAQAKAEQRQEAHLDKPSSVQEMVRMELEAKDRAAKEAAEKDAEKAERQSISERLAKLTEAKPEAPQPRRQRIMWGRK